MVATRTQSHDEVLTAGKLGELLAAQTAELAPAWAALHPDLAQRLSAALDAASDELLLPPMSYEAFLEWARSSAGDSVHAEWVDGKVATMSPASTQHQAIVVFLVTLLNFFVARHGLGHVFTAPYQMRLRQLARGREPDVCFVAQAHAGRIGKQYLDGPADLVIEVVSPESAQRDREEKYAEYAAAGVREYWLIDPDQARADFFRLDEGGGYVAVAGGHSGVYTSPLIPGLTIHLEWFWQEPLPPVWELVQL